MEPKSLRFASLILLSKYFSSQEQDERFFQDFTNRSVLKIYTLDVRIFQECEFFKTFEELNLTPFIGSPPKKVWSSVSFGNQKWISSFTKELLILDRDSYLLYGGAG